MIKKPKNRDWFCKGGRHGLSNRIADFGQVIESQNFNNMSAVDIGAAEGDISRWLLENFNNVTAIEYMDDAFNKLGKNFIGENRVVVEQNDIGTFPLKQQYDVVFLLGVLHYFNSEFIREQVLQHCLDHTNYLCIVRAAIFDFRQRDNRRLEVEDRFIKISTLKEIAGSDFSSCVIDNGYRGVDELRLGDLVVFRHEIEGNPLPTIKSMFSSVEGYCKAF